MAVMKQEWSFKARALVTVFLVGSLLSGLFALQKGINFFEPSEEKRIIYTYQVSSSDKYQVKLKENSFIQEEYMQEGLTYITDLVEYIEVDFDYTFNGSDESEIIYKYDIYIDLQIKYRTNKFEETKMWHKKYPIKKMSDEVSAKQIIINETLAIDYNYYNQKAIDFYDQFQLPIEAEIDIVMEVRLDGEYGNQNFKDEYKQKLSMPATMPAFTINKGEVYQEDGKLIEYVGIEKKIDCELSQWGFALMIMSLALFVIFFEKIFNIQKYSPYEKERNKILKEFGDIIIETKSPIARSGLTIIEVKSFKEMLDLEEELRIPIVFFENEEKQYGEFSLLHQKILYIFEL